MIYFWRWWMACPRWARILNIVACAGCGYGLGRLSQVLPPRVLALGLIMVGGTLAMIIVREQASQRRSLREIDALMDELRRRDEQRE